jgi:hypothetical protein
LLATVRAIGFAWSVGQLKPGLPWRRGAAEAAIFGWLGRQPPFFDAEPLAAYHVKSFSDQLWLESMLETGHRVVPDIPDEYLSFMEAPDLD